MLKIKKTHRFIFSALILLIVLVSVYVRRKNASPIRDGELIRLPDFIATDITGNKIKSTDLKGKYLYVQFIRPIDENNIGLFDKVYSNWKDKDLIFLIIGKRYDQIKSNMNIDSTKVAILIDDYDRLKSLFNAPEYGTHYLFAKKGKTIYSAENNVNYEHGIKKYLQLSVNRDGFEISKFVPKKNHINQIQGFEQISKLYQEKKKEYFIVAMIASFCDSCLPGPIIEVLKRINSIGEDRGYVFCILSKKYNENDVEIFRSQLQIEFPVVISDNNLSRKWNYFINRYTEQEVNNIVFVINKSGYVEKVLDANCRKCWRSFFRWIDKELLQKG